MFNDLQLYKVSRDVILPEPVAVFKAASGHEITEKGIKITSRLSSDIDVLSVEGRITISNENEPPVIGHVLIDAKSFRTPYDIKWMWGLSPKDIALIEAHRHGRELQVFLSLNGIFVEGNGKVLSFFGSSLTTIATSEWVKVLGKHTGANNPAIQVPPSLFCDHSWEIASDRLKKVNHLLYRGETRLALEECLSLIESYVTNPYDKKNWEKCIDQGEYAQRRDALTSLFSGISTFLNKVGHHRSKKERDENDQLILMPLDHYEAEVAGLITHLVVVYLERLKASGTLKIE